MVCVCTHECVSTLVCHSGHVLFLMFVKKLFVLSRCCSQSSSSLLDNIQTLFLPTALLHSPSLSLTALTAYTSSSSLFLMSLLINPNCSWNRTLSQLKWFGAVGSDSAEPSRLFGCRWISFVRVRWYLYHRDEEGMK